MAFVRQRRQEARRAASRSPASGLSEEVAQMSRERRQQKARAARESSGRRSSAKHANKYR